MKKTAVKLLFVGSLGYVLLCAFLYFSQESLLYFPKERSMTDPAHTYLLETEVGHTVVTTEVKHTRQAILYFGGNAEDVSQRLSEFKQTFPEYSLYLMHYRGYGGSDGQPREESLYRDALKLYRNVEQTHSDIVLIGRSLGSGIATRLAAQVSPSQLILVTPYSSIEDVASERYWGIPVSLLLKDKYLSWRYAQSVTAQTAIFLATDDPVISSASTLKLFEHFPAGVATVYRFENEGHNSFASKPYYFQLLRELTRRQN